MERPMKTEQKYPSVADFTKDEKFFIYSCIKMMNSRPSAKGRGLQLDAAYALDNLFASCGMPSDFQGTIK